MRLQLISDLHTEFLTGRELVVLQAIPIEKDLDFLVVAGDFVVPGYQGAFLVEKLFAALSEMARHILFVIGNHEYYKGSKERTEQKLKEAMASHLNIHWLNNGELTLDGVHFVGGPMWYPTGDGLNGMYARQMADHFEIESFNWAERENAIFNTVVNSAATSDTIVITHHMPHPLTTPWEYRNSTLNRFFVSDQSYTMKTRRPKLWLFGHTHMECDMIFESTRMVCNPYGYPSERAGRLYKAVVFDV
jgi:predicted MPP superfamily phosphohydrolase